MAGGNTRTYGLVGGVDGEAFVRVQQGSADDLFELARDFQGTILALIQRTNPASVSVVERYRYEPFGKVAIENASGQPLPQSGFGNDRFFLGRIWDAEVGIYDVRARWYEPDLGAFLAPDPLGAVDSWNFYQYGLAEPNSVMDPFGLQADAGAARSAASEAFNAVQEEIRRLRASRKQAVEQGNLALVSCIDDLLAVNQEILKELGSALSTTTVSEQPGTQSGSGDSGGGYSWGDFSVDAASLVVGGVVAKVGVKLVLKGWRWYRAYRAYQTAARGGIHGGMLNNMASRTLREVEKAAKSYREVVQKHKDMINNPGKYYKEADKWSAEELNRNIEKWKNDIKRNQTLADIMQELAKRMKE